MNNTGTCPDIDSDFLKYPNIRELALLAIMHGHGHGPWMMELVLAKNNKDGRHICGGSVFFSRGTHKVRDDLQLSYFVG